MDKLWAKCADLGRARIFVRFESSRELPVLRIASAACGSSALFALPCDDNLFLIRFQDECLSALAAAAAAQLVCAEPLCIQPSVAMHELLSGSRLLFTSQPQPQPQSQPSKARPCRLLHKSRHCASAQLGSVAATGCSSADWTDLDKRLFLRDSTRPKKPRFLGSSLRSGC